MKILKTRRVTPSFQLRPTVIFLVNLSNSPLTPSHRITSLCGYEKECEVNAVVGVTPHFITQVPVILIVFQHNTKVRVPLKAGYHMITPMGQEQSTIKTKDEWSNLPKEVFPLTFDCCGSRLSAWFVVPQRSYPDRTFDEWTLVKNK